MIKAILLILNLLLIQTANAAWLNSSELNKAKQTRVDLTVKTVTVDKEPIAGVNVYASTVDNWLNLSGAVLSGTTDSDGKHVFRSIAMGYYFIGVEYNGIYIFYKSKPSYNGSTPTKLVKSITRTFKLSDNTMHFVEPDALFLTKKATASVEVVCSQQCPEKIRVWHNGVSLPKSNFNWNPVGSLTMIGNTSNLPPGPLFVTDYYTGARTTNSLTYASFTSQKVLDAVTQGAVTPKTKPVVAPKPKPVPEPTPEPEPTPTPEPEPIPEPEPTPEPEPVEIVEAPAQFTRQANNWAYWIWWWNGNEQYAFIAQAPNGAIYTYRESGGCDYEEDADKIRAEIDYWIEQDKDIECMKVIADREINYGLEWDWNDDMKWVDQGNGWSYFILEQDEDWEYIQAKHNDTGIILEWTDSEFDEHNVCDYESDGDKIRMWLNDFVNDRNNSTPYWIEETGIFVYECPGQVNGTGYWTGTESITECKQEQCMRPEGSYTKPEVTPEPEPIVIPQPIPEPVITLKPMDVHKDISVTRFISCLEEWTGGNYRPKPEYTTAGFLPSAHYTVGYAGEYPGINPTELAEESSWNFMRDKWYDYKSGNYYQYRSCSNRKLGIAPSWYTPERFAQEVPGYQAVHNTTTGWIEISLSPNQPQGMVWYTQETAADKFRDLWIGTSTSSAEESQWPWGNNEIFRWANEAQPAGSITYDESKF